MNEIQFIHDSTGDDLYAVAIAPSAAWANITNEVLEALVVASWTEYETPLTETSVGSYFYVADFPNWITVPGDYSIVIYRRVGGSPVITDTRLAKGVVRWDGIQEIQTAGDDNMNRGEMRDEVVAAIDREDMDALINTRLNWALDWVAGLHPWRVLIEEDVTTTLVESQKSYSKPDGTGSFTSNFRTIRSVRYVNETSGVGATLEAKDLESFQDDDPYPKGQAESVPIRWSSRSTYIDIVPIPSSAEAGEKLYITGIELPTAMSADGSTSGLNRDLDMAIVFRAISLCFATIDEIEGDAQYWEDRARVAASEAWIAEEGFSEV